MRIAISATGSTLDAEVDPLSEIQYRIEEVEEKRS